MAKRLEVLVQQRMGKYQLRTLLSEKPVADDNGLPDDISELPDLLANSESEGKSISAAAFQRFFQGLWLSLGSDNQVQSHEVLISARSLAAELIAQ